MPYFRHTLSFTVHPFAQAVCAVTSVVTPCSGDVLCRVLRVVCCVLCVDARKHAAALIDAEPEEILFTASGTESDNTAVRGYVTVRDCQRLSRRYHFGCRALLFASRHVCAQDSCELVETSSL